MEIIRGRLSAADFSNPALRYNPDTDTVQYSSDGGTNWVDDPGDDPRHGAKFAKPLLDTSDPRCDAAANMVKWLRDFIEYETSILTAGAELVAVSNSIFPLFDILAPWAVLVQGLIDLAGIIFDIGSVALEGAFTSDQYDLMLCAFYCNIEGDGSVTPGDLADIQTQIGTDLNTTAALITNLILSTQGEMGVQNAGAIGSETGDCDDCECLTCGYVDFTIGLNAWSILNDGTINARGKYVSGTGIQTTLVGDSPDEIYVYYRPAEFNVHRIVIQGHQFPSGTPVGTLELILGGTTVVTDHFFPPFVADWQVTWAGNEDIDGINLSLTLPGGGALERLYFYVVGDLPAWLTPC